MQNPIIKVEHLSHQYEMSQPSMKALDDVSFEIARGSCTAIIGYNGSGKSTLIQHFNGLLRPTEGTVLVDGINVGDRRKDLRALRQRVGMLFQYPESQLFEQTVFADVAFGPQRMHLGRREVRTRVRSALDSVGLPHQLYGSRSPFALSGGQRRRVALAGILAMSPTILILDEPTIGLDGEGRAEFYACLQRLQRERDITIIIVSHDMSEVAMIADWVCVLYQGHLMAQGTPREIFTHNEQLRQWGLTVPPLQQLLARLHRRDVAVPLDLLTVDEVLAFLLEQKHAHQRRDQQRTRTYLATRPDQMPHPRAERSAIAPVRLMRGQGKGHESVIATPVDVSNTHVDVPDTRPSRNDEDNDPERTLKRPVVIRASSGQWRPGNPYTRKNDERIEE